MKNLATIKPDEFPPVYCSFAGEDKLYTPDDFLGEMLLRRERKEVDECQTQSHLQQSS